MEKQVTHQENPVSKAKKESRKEKEEDMRNRKEPTDHAGPLQEA